MATCLVAAMLSGCQARLGAGGYSPPEATASIAEADRQAIFTEMQQADAQSTGVGAQADLARATARGRVLSQHAISPEQGALIMQEGRERGW